MTPHEQVADEIIQKQAQVLGSSLALARARRVGGLAVGEDGHIQSISGDPLQVIVDLVVQYQELLGPAAISFSRDAAVVVTKQHPELVLPELLISQ